MSVEESSAYEEFMPAVDNKVFSEAVLSESGGRNVVVTGSSRLDEDGIIPVSYTHLFSIELLTFIIHV